MWRGNSWPEQPLFAHTSCIGKHDFGLGEEAVVPREKPTQAQTPNKKIKIRNLLAVRQQC